VGRGTGQVAAGQVDSGGHELAVAELEPAAIRDAASGEQPDSAGGSRC
jgi:hypothetical protein